MNCNCAICRNNKPFIMPKEIVQAAIDENLVLFCGAGISTESKTVMPYSFYSDIKEEIDNKDDSISFSALMQKFCAQPNGRRKLIQKIKDRFDYIHSFPELERNATRFHRELSSLFPIKTIITTNWDTYFEDCCGAVPITRPEDFSLYDSKKRHVLKIHGSIDNISSIVATTNDYNACYERLTKGIIGATLKEILATKVVVFIGFSFGDEDFNQIMRYINDEMGEYSSYFYVVTLDDGLSGRIDNKNCTSIITDGTYFLHELHKALIDMGIMLDYTKTSSAVESLLDSIGMLHENTSRISITNYPCVIYTLMHQDGLIHAFERFHNGNKNGEYCNPDFMTSSIAAYEDIVKKMDEKKKYTEKAYYKGYLDGLIFIRFYETNPEIIKKMPVFYLPGIKATIRTIKTYHRNLEKTLLDNSVFSKEAEGIIEHFLSQSKGDIRGIVIHHPPF